MAVVKPWSFSKIKSFEQCPKQFYHEKVLKEYPFVKTQATIYGNAFHKAAELYIKDNEPLPDEFQFAQNFLDTLAAKRGVKFCERKMGVKENLEACDFYDERAWFRGIADLLIIDVLGEVAWVVDYKTSKSSRYADKGQLELMALAVFAHFPEIKKVRAGLVFVLVNDLVKHTYEEQDKADLWEKWIIKHNGLRAAAESDTWNARPNGLCKRHCPVVECIHNGVNA
jgi:RecB family exonuclease